MREKQKPVAVIARGLGIHAGSVANWVNRVRIERGEADGLAVGEWVWLCELERENAELRMERDVRK